MPVENMVRVEPNATPGSVALTVEWLPDADESIRRALATLAYDSVAASLGIPTLIERICGGTMGILAHYTAERGRASP